MCKTSQTFRKQGPRTQDLTVLQNSFKKTDVVHLILSHGDKRKKNQLNTFSEKILKYSVDSPGSLQAV